MPAATIAAGILYTGGMIKPKNQLQCVLHGSFGRHFESLKHVRELFEAAGIAIAAPKRSDITGLNGSFLLLDAEERLDPRLVELRYLHAVKRLRGQGFSYIVNPDGLIGPSVAYELAAAQFIGVPVYFWARPDDLPVYVPDSHILPPDDLAAYVQRHGHLPGHPTSINDRHLHDLWSKLIENDPSIATGGIIEYHDRRSRRYPEILLVKTHKWGGRYSLVGGKLHPGERLADALVREIHEETGLAAQPGAHLCTFDEIKNSGYYLGAVHHIFVDYIVATTSRRVRLNEEAQDYIWVPAEAALAELDIEPNARHTLELYAARL
jgi:8-oxo-dGTP pyrophosphatase MutT (NUDIX family)